MLLDWYNQENDLAQEHRHRINAEKNENVFHDFQVSVEKKIHVWN